jgi:hypothetical protein
MTLEEEAIKYAVSVYKGSQKDVYENSSRLDFIAGANSKWVQHEKIQIQIDVLKHINSLMREEVVNFGINYGSSEEESTDKWDKTLWATIIADNINILNQQLKQLEDVTR